MDRDQYEQIIRSRRRTWGYALTNANYEQGRNKLRNGNGTWCCLGVACDVFKTDLGITSREMGDHYTFAERGDLIGNSMTLPESLRKYLGLTPGAQSILMHLNDNGVSFKVIAGLLNYLEIEEPQEK